MMNLNEYDEALHLIDEYEKNNNYTLTDVLKLKNFFGEYEGDEDDFDTYLRLNLLAQNLSSAYYIDELGEFAILLPEFFIDKNKELFVTGDLATNIGSMSISEICSKVDINYDRICKESKEYLEYYVETYPDNSISNILVSTVNDYDTDNDNPSFICYSGRDDLYVYAEGFSMKIMGEPTTFEEVFEKAIRIQAHCFSYKKD